jgi:hypothetical protein
MLKFGTYTIFLIMSTYVILLLITVVNFGLKLLTIFRLPSIATDILMYYTSILLHTHYMFRPLQVYYIIRYFLRSYLTITDPLFVYIFDFMFW